MSLATYLDICTLISPKMIVIVATNAVLRNILQTKKYSGGAGSG